MQSHTAEILARNRRFIPGGTASNARYLAETRIFCRAEGATLWDMEGNSYVDLNCAFGAVLLGHRDRTQLQRIAELTGEIDLIGLGATEIEGLLAETLCSLIPCAEMIAYCTSGTEATFHAIRLARAVTNRTLIVKFQGAYHGWHDYVARNFTSSAARLGTCDPISAGALQSSLDATLVLPFNDTEAVDQLFRTRGDEIAAVLVEPQMHNVGGIAEETEFFATLRRQTSQSGSILIFDEVITGVRHALGGYQSICGVTPDLATFGKALGNGFPISLIAGRRSLMQHFAPPAMGGDVLLGGTYNGHPVCVAAGIAVIEAMQAPGAYDRLYALGARLRDGLEGAAAVTGSTMQVCGYGSVCAVHFASRRARRYEDLVDNDAGMDAAFRKGLLNRGFACSLTPLRRFHLTLKHTAADVDRLCAAAEDILLELKSSASNAACTG